jgi:hypothetical protein
VHKALAIDNSRGLSNFLSSDVPALAVAHDRDSEPVRDSGRADAAESGGASLRIEDAFVAGQLGDRFTQIIVDSPPVLGLADSIVLGDQVGAVLFVVSSGSTRKGMPARR